MTATVSLPILDRLRGVQAVPAAARPVSLVDRPVQWLRLDPAKMWREHGRCHRYVVPASFFNGKPLPPGEVEGSLLENGVVLGPPAQKHAVIRKTGQGRYSLWSSPEQESVGIFFSSSDGSDPATNGRTYTLVSRPLTFHGDWEHLHYRRWLNHSRGRYFLRHGGDRIPPPLFANLGVTDICNLQCGICGSQNMLQPVNRRHMDYRVFSMVAQTLFPLLVTVEFNSRGEPLIHPNIEDMLETVLDHGIFFRLQTNGTQFQARKLQLLSQMTGELSVSIDATGDLFEYARTNGKWPQVDQGMRNLLRLRDRDKLGVYIYPTLTAKTIEGAPALIDWAMEIGVDKIDFHLYDPINQGVEARPSTEQLDALKRHAASLDPKHPTAIFLNYEPIKPGDPPALPHPPQTRHPNIPRAADAPGAHPAYACMAPVQLVDIDLDGCVCVCCMLQERKLGNALTVEAFADCWFGAEYQAVRESLKRTSPMALYEQCRGCVKAYAGG